MEILLAILLAAAIVTGAWLWAGRKDALARERQLRSEISGMKRASPSLPSALSSPDLRPLFPERAHEPLDSPERGAVLEATEARELPGTGNGPGFSPSALSVPSHVQDAADRHRDALRALDVRLSRLRPAESRAIPSAPPSPPGSEPGAERLFGSVAGMGSAVEQFVDQSTRLRNDVEAAGVAATRVTEALEAALPLAREAAHQTEALSPFVSALSGLADRLNLLSIDLTLAEEGPGGPGAAPRKEANVEIRALFDETRTFSRDLGARARKATEAARRSQEAFSSIRDAADGARERSSAASGRGEELAALAGRMEEAVEALRAASDGARLEWEKLSRLRWSLEHRLATERQIAERRARDAAAGADADEAARAAVREERQAAEELAESLRSLARR
jgi:hypothetical protein